MKNIFKNFGADFSASVVVFLVALPLCLGIALGSGAPLFSGLIAGIVGGIVVGSFSGSQLSVSGPAAGLTAIVAAGILKVPAFEAFLLSVIIAGIVQIILGYIKAGVFGDYIPTNVIKGMLSAIGIILILKQIPHLFGYDADFEGDYAFAQQDSENTFSGIWHTFSKITPLAIIIGVVALGIQIFWDKVLVKKGKIFKLIPAPLVVVVAGVLMNMFLSNGSSLQLRENQLVNIPSADGVGEFFSFFMLPDFKYLGMPEIWITGITIAIVASLETMLNIEASDELDPYKRVTPKDRELKAQGIGNLVSGLIGGLPVTSVVVRTSANINGGGRTKAATIMHGIMLLLAVALIPFLINLIPLSALAAVLIYTGYKLAKPSLFKEMYRGGFDQFVPFVVTITAIIFTDLLIGIVIGIGVGLFFVLRSNFKTSFFVVHDDSKYLFRLRKDVSFLNKPLLKNKLEQVPENSSVLIDISRADFIDKDVIEVINDFLQHAPLKNIKTHVKKSPAKTRHAKLKSHQLNNQLN
ncbi:SulP family inorganic anion transporter [Parafilimonas terrae]|jgi:carbonic anhydrase|uniref:Carbonic anhydrase n=1 Tax=Parafilimonas terrae TaxID=1465490 RepID=A0A1I5VUT2_9BACT|nr:SulP family inorganic anion transporter [Parafilimonas terrae]SFQ11057.1 carbonic anhydrase [Parafilimonas terrae]